MQKLGLDNLPKPRTKARTALLMAPPDLDVRSSFEVGDTVYLTRGAFKAKPPTSERMTANQIIKHRQRKTTCNCQNAGSTDIERSDHSAQCNKALNWIVRVTYTTQAGHVAHMDSVRLCMADAARLRGQYDTHKAVICRVYPLRAS